MKVFERIWRVISRFYQLPARIVRIQEALGRIEQRQLGSHQDISNVEFRVYSQWGEDGIIQYLINHVEIDRPLFVEFGVENYLESNTRFLLINNHWSGLVIDGSADNIEFIRKDQIYWACNLKAVHSFVTKENIEQLLSDNGVTGDIGLLSVDIDGNDYWIWEGIISISPRIVVCEYNGHFGPNAMITIPYDAHFVRDLAHHSKIYYGASISALCSLAKVKGYSLVASNRAGNNIFFVRNDLIGQMHALTPLEAYCRSQFREYHDATGKLTFDDFETRLNNIAHLHVYDLSRRDLTTVGEAMHLPGFIETPSQP